MADDEADQEKSELWKNVENVEIEIVRPPDPEYYRTRNSLRKFLLKEYFEGRLPMPWHLPVKAKSPPSE